MIRVSVVVPTRNRFESLERCLSGLQGQSLDRAEFEVIVVDNGSTDGTRACVERMQEAMPHLRYAFVSAPGAARARNTGIDVARAEIIAFVDDDAVPAARWLVSLLDGHARWPQAGAISGCTQLRFTTRRPRWLHRDLETWHSARDRHGELGTRPLVDLTATIAALLECPVPPGSDGNPIALRSQDQRAPGAMANGTNWPPNLSDG